MPPKTPSTDIYVQSLRCFYPVVPEQQLVSPPNPLARTACNLCFTTVSMSIYLLLLYIPFRKRLTLYRLVRFLNNNHHAKKGVWRHASYVSCYTLPSAHEEVARDSVVPVAANKTRAASLSLTSVMSAPSLLSPHLVSGSRSSARSQSGAIWRQGRK